MPRPNEIAADARALYGPAAVRPAAGDMGDGALWVDPGDHQALWQVQSGNWRQIALPPADDDSSIPTGVPVLRGPYVVDYTDIPHDGDTRVLWTPRAGDLLYGLYTDMATLMDGQQGGSFFNNGGLQYGTVAQPTLLSGTNAAYFGLNQGSSLFGVPCVVTTTSPIQVRYAANGDASLSAGHAELYALVARAVAP